MSAFPVRRHKLTLTIVATLAVMPALMAQASTDTNEQTRLARGIALFLQSSDHKLDAITQLDIDNHSPESASLLSDLLASYDLKDQAASIVQQALALPASGQQRMDLQLSLARLELNKGDYAQAQQRLESLQPATPEQQDQKYFLLGRIALNRKHLGAAAEHTEKISANSIWRAYMHYNIGIHLTENWDTGRQWLDKINHMVRFSLDDPEFLALADQANLAMALIALNKRDTAQAGNYISRARKKGPTSNQSLLAAGWISYAKNNPDQALAHWQLLRDKGQSDKASLESLIAIAQAYEKLDNNELAALTYELAAARYAELRQQIEDSIAKLDVDKLIVVLEGDTKTLADPEPDDSALAFLIPEAADTGFQLEINRYRDLLQIQARLMQWQQRLPLIEQGVSRQLASVSEHINGPSSYTRAGFFDTLKTRLAALQSRLTRVESSNQVESLADQRERSQLDRLSSIRDSLAQLDNHPGLMTLRQRHRLLSGLVTYNLHSNFKQRYDAFREILDNITLLLQRSEKRALDLPARLRQGQQRLERLRQSSTAGNDTLPQAIRRSDDLVARQRKQLHNLAISVLEARREHLDKLYLNARHSHVRVLDRLFRQQDGGQ